MAYDLHVVRTRHWLDAPTDPITKADADALIESDPELAWSTTDYVDMRDDSGAVARYFAIRWNGEPCFFWYRHEIRCSGPSKAQVRKLVEVATKLRAYALGDEDERYEFRKSFFGKPKVVLTKSDA